MSYNVNAKKVPDCSRALNHPLHPLGRVAPPTATSPYCLLQHQPRQSLQKEKKKLEDLTMRMLLCLNLKPFTEFVGFIFFINIYCNIVET